MVKTLGQDELLLKKGVSRRKFVKGVGTAFAGAALFATGGSVLLNGGLLDVPGRSLVRSTFEQYLGQVFRVRTDKAGTLSMKLIGIRDLPAPAPQDERSAIDREQSFSLMFRGPGSSRLEQDTYRFEHDRMGRFSLFIVPMSPTQSAQGYQAVFNRM